MDPLNANNGPSILLEGGDGMMGDGSDAIDQMIGEFQETVSQTRRKMNVIPHVNQGEMKQNVEELADYYSEARNLLERIEDTIQDAPNAGKYLRTLRLCTKDFERLRQRYDKMMLRDNLNRYLSENSQLTKERRSLLVEDALVESNTRSIEDITRRLGDTTETGGMIMSDLKGQTDQLKRSVNKVVDTDEVLKESKKILDGMARSAATNKLTTALIILLELLIIFFIIWYKYLSA
mmetsp:Transcript_32132/g.62805  ORF Transcript_32132/g.62805 Transcript_32132/m.62805 type:complete len:235 (-) Transcript_32132:93-797(-)